MTRSLFGAHTPYLTPQTSHLILMEKFLSCDWGTSSFRLRLVDKEHFKIEAEEISAKGILDTFNLWNQKGDTDPEARILFYIEIISEHLDKLERKLNISLDGVPLVISGMASSSIGMISLPYHQMPFALDGSGIETKYQQASSGFNHDILLISGVKSEDDVMRGEETQLIGIYKEDPDTATQIYIFPGTHSKHIIIKDKQAVRFKTYMTGEFFELLSKKSILHSTVEKNADLHQANCLESFKQGVRDSCGSNLLHACFRVRTNNLFGILDKKENYHYLSGLLIGAELQDLSDNDSIIIYLCCGSGLRANYETALYVLGLDHKTHIFSAQSVDESVIIGQSKILSNKINA